MGGRFYFTDEQFQSELTDLTAGRARRPRLQPDHRFQGLRLQRRRSGPQGQDLVVGLLRRPADQDRVDHGHPTTAYLTNLDVKLNFQLIPENRAEIFIQAGKKEKFGRSSSTCPIPPGWNQCGKYHFGSPTYQVPGRAHVRRQPLRLECPLRVTRTPDSACGRRRRGHDRQHLVQQRKGHHDGGPPEAKAARPGGSPTGRTSFGVAQVQYFNDNLFGTSHEMKVGVEINHNSAGSVGYFYGSKIVPTWNYNSRPSTGTRTA